VALEREGLGLVVGYRFRKLSSKGLRHNDRGVLEYSVSSLGSKERENPSISCDDSIEQSCSAEVE
jgi:hypothetical protein